MQIWMLLFHKRSLEFIFKNTCNWEKPCIMHIPFVMSNSSYWVIVSMKFSLIEILYSFQVIKRFHIKKSRLQSKSLALDMHFSLMWNPIQKPSHFWITWQRRVPTLVKKSDSWLREMVVINGCYFSVWSQTMSRLLHKGEGFEGRNREGAPETPGERKCAEESGFWGGTAGRKTFLLMWLSCPPLLYFSRPTLARLSLTMFVFFLAFVNQISHFEQCLCATVGITHTSLGGQSLMTWGRRKACLSWFCSSRWLTVSTLCQTDFNTALSVSAVRLWLP